MVDILAIGAHPDDVELGCAGTLLKHIALGYKVAILDLTQGELGTRGSVAIRKKEAAAAGQILGITVRKNLQFKDGFFQNDEKHQMRLIHLIRKYKPTIVIGNAHYDRHPDHGRAAALIRDACFLSGLSKIVTKQGNKVQPAHRPIALYHYIQALHQTPDLVVDISPFFDQKLKAIQAFASQFYDAKSNAPKTFISSPEFMEFVRARALHFGVPIGVKYAEGFTVNRTVGVNDLTQLL